MTPCHGPSLGRRMGACRRYPSGNEYSSILLIVFRASPNYRATAPRLLPSTSTARRPRAYRSTSYMPPVSHGKHLPCGIEPAAEPRSLPLKVSVVRETRMWRGGLLLLRHVTPLTRRNVVYFCAAAYSLLIGRDNLSGDSSFCAQADPFQDEPDRTRNAYRGPEVSIADTSGQKLPFIQWARPSPSEP